MATKGQDIMKRLIYLNIVESSDVVYGYIIAVDLDINLYFWLLWQQNEKLLSQSFEVVTRYTSELVSIFCTTHLCRDLQTAFPLKYRASTDDFKS